MKSIITLLCAALCPRTYTDAAPIHRIGPKRGQTYDRSRAMGANSGDRIFSLLSEPPSDAASAQGLGRFSTRRAPWPIQATLAMNRQKARNGAAIGTGERLILAKCRF